MHGRGIVLAMAHSTCEFSLDVRQWHKKNGEPARLLTLAPLPQLAGGEGSGVRGRTAVGDCRPHARSDAARQSYPARLGIPGSAAGSILFRPDTGRADHHAHDLLRFDGVLRQPRRSASTQHSRGRPCRAESDVHDGTSGFGTVDYGPFATRRSQTRSLDCVGLAQTRLSPGLGEIVVVGGRARS